MENSKLVFEAYKPAECLAFNFFAIKEALTRLLQEQKFSRDLENMLYKVYSNFKSNIENLIGLYTKVPEVLNLDRLLDNMEDEVSSIFENAGFFEALMPTKDALDCLLKFIALLNADYLSEADKCKDAIPGFSWDIQSFKDAFQQIEKKGLAEYEQSSDE